MVLMVLKTLGFFREPCLVDHLVKLIDHLSMDLSAPFQLLSMAFLHPLFLFAGRDFIWRDFFIPFPHLCIVTVLGKLDLLLLLCLLWGLS